MHLEASHPSAISQVTVLDELWGVLGDSVKMQQRVTGGAGVDAATGSHSHLDCRQVF